MGSPGGLLSGFCGSVSESSLSSGFVTIISRTPAPTLRFFTTEWRMVVPKRIPFSSHFYFWAFCYILGATRRRWAMLPPSQKTPGSAEFSVWRGESCLDSTPNIYACICRVLSVYLPSMCQILHRAAREDNIGSGRLFRWRQCCLSASGCYFTALQFISSIIIDIL